MLGGLESLPVLVVQLVFDVLLLVVGATVVLRAHRRAGLAVLAGAGLSLFTSIVGPLILLSSFGGVIWYSGASGGQAVPGGEAVWIFVVLAMVMGSWSPYLARAMEAAAVAYALVALVRRLPPSARDDLGGVPPGAR